MSTRTSQPKPTTIALVPRRPRTADVTEDQLHSIPVAANRLGVSRATLYRMIDAGLIRCTSVGASGRGKRVSEREIRRYIHDHEGRR